jgi:hypothetical protein
MALSGGGGGLCDVKTHRHLGRGHCDSHSHSHISCSEHLHVAQGTSTLTIGSALKRNSHIAPNRGPECNGVVACPVRARTVDPAQTAVGSM